MESVTSINPYLKLLILNITQVCLCPAIFFVILYLKTVSFCSWFDFLSTQLLTQFNSIIERPCEPSPCSLLRSFWVYMKKARKNEGLEKSHFHLHFTGPFSLAVRETQCCTSMRHLVQIRIKKKTLKYDCVHNYYTMKGNYFDSSRLNQVWQQNSLHTKTAEKLCFVFVIFFFCVCVCGLTDSRSSVDKN